MNQRLIHDTAFACGVSILEVFGSLLRDEEKRDAVSEIYDRVVAAIEAYQIQKSREEARRCPSKT